MLTVSETRQRTLNSTDEIAAYLDEIFQAMADESPFKTGEMVAITSRAGLAPEIAVGDVGIMLCDLPGQLYSWVLVLTSGGQRLPIQVQTANLAKREPTAGGEA